ncbi:MAG: L-threonylcarbamoyladenylate synthase [Nanoarchaeota archaeon]
MRTELKKSSAEVIRQAGELIRKGEVVAFPTETVYGLGANALDEDAVKKIFEAKGRPSDNPLIVHVSDKKHLARIVETVPHKAELLIERFWPGPLTLILRKGDRVPMMTTGGRNNVGVRMPNHAVALSLIAEAGYPIAAPSANSFGRPSPTLAKHVFEDLDGKIPLIIDGGACQVGLESTIIDMTSETPMILRPGGITVEEIEDVIGTVDLHPTVTDPEQKTDIAQAPGMKYRHYSPKAKVILVHEGDLAEITGSCTGSVGIISLSEIDVACKETIVVPDVTTLAQDIFRLFRHMDAIGIDTIIVNRIPEEGLGLSILNRVRKAASDIN